MNPADLVQRSDAWFAYRAGRVTGSRIADVIATTKAGKPTAARATYMKLLVAERLSGAPQGNGRVVRSLEDRAALEPDARSAYEWEHGTKIQVVGFVDHPRIKFAGCSPDGLVGLDGMVEFKALDGAQHCELMQTNDIDAEYLAQMQFGLACTERAWCDFGAYCPTMREKHKLWTCRIQRDDIVIKQMESAVSEFLAEVDQKVKRLLAL